MKRLSQRIGKYLVNAVLNKTVCAYIKIIIIVLNVPENNKYSQPHV